MRASAQYSADPYAYDDYDANPDYMPSELLAGERIGRPLRRSRWKTLLRYLIVIGVSGGVTWSVLRDPAAWWDRYQWVSGQVSALTASMERKTLPSREGIPRVDAGALPSSDLANAPALDRLPSTESPSVLERSAPSPLPPVKSATVPLTTGSLPPAAIDKPEPLPPPTVDRADPYQVKAEAVGLHPGLSRVLLARLTDADYRNARTAIEKALAETADDAVFVWPKQHKSGLALFKVHFVPGATSDCRRYVVTVTKDGWATTALPMERCGAQAGRLRRRAG
jgi:hypothetical protein